MSEERIRAICNEHCLNFPEADRLVLLSIARGLAEPTTKMAKINVPWMNELFILCQNRSSRIVLRNQVILVE